MHEQLFGVHDRVHRHVFGAGKNVYQDFQFLKPCKSIHLMGTTNCHFQVACYSKFLQYTKLIAITSF